MMTECSAPAVDTLVWVGAQHAAAMQDLFKLAFGHEMSAAHWEWKYGDGRGFGVGLMRGEQMIAHYGGMSRAVRFRGRAMLAAQGCDVMSNPSVRGALGRRGAFFQVAEACTAGAVGGGRAHAIGFGFPNERSYGVGERLGLWHVVDAVIGLSWSSSPMAAGRRLTLEALGRDGDGQIRAASTVNRLWRRMAQAFPESIVGVRNSEWLVHRYLNHPFNDYEVLLVRRGLLRRAAGVLVLRTQAHHLDLMDLVACPDQFPLLIDVARARAHAMGFDRVNAWVTESHKPLLCSPLSGTAQVTDMRLLVPHLTHVSAPSEEEVRGRWFLLAGDADFT